MSSAILYVAIVVVWAIVLVPMWLRRDGDGFSPRRLLHRRSDGAESQDSPGFEAGDEPSGEPLPDSLLDEGADVSDVPRHRRPLTRATVIARRRRRTLCLGLAVAISAVVVLAKLGPWWLMAPPLLLLAGHLSLLRVAVRIDGMRRTEALAATRARASRHSVHETEVPVVVEHAVAAPVAEVIELARPGQVYDQYADAELRAVGD